MKKSQLDKAMERVIDFKMEAVDALVKEVIEPLKVTDNPEDLIKKPFNQWTPQDLQILGQIYGTGDDTVLARFIFKKKLEEVRELEAEEVV